MPQLAIKNIRLQYIQFRTNPNFYAEQENQSVSIKYHLTINHKFNENSLIVQIIVKTPSEDEDKNSPFYFEIVVTGEFKLIGEVEKSIINQYANINCPAIIFPYLREILADVTRRSGFPPFHLPPINFVKLHDKETIKEKPKENVRKRSKKKL